MSSSEIMFSTAQALEVFGLKAMPEEKELGRIYKELAKKYHPDLTLGDTQKMSALNMARDVLLKEIKNGTSIAIITDIVKPSIIQDIGGENVKLLNLDTILEIMAYPEKFVEFRGKQVANLYPSQFANFGKDTNFVLDFCKSGTRLDKDSMLKYVLNHGWNNQQNARMKVFQVQAIIEAFEEYLRNEKS